MRRRQFITLLGGAAATWPFAARAQQGERMRRIGVLIGVAERDPQTAPALAVFTKGLQDLGWIDGRNIRIDYRFAAADVDRMQAFAKELVGLQPDVIVGETTPVVAALARETRTIPIVFVIVSDPVGSGFVASLPRPGGNITGFINIESSLSGKWIEMLKDIVPRTTRAALMFNPETAPYFACSRSKPPRDPLRSSRLPLPSTLPPTSSAPSRASATDSRERERTTYFWRAVQDDGGRRSGSGALSRLGAGAP
jgi:putative ABC transport system substrate-binding protein